MKIYRQIENIDIHKPVVTIGFFDGVHRGHHEILRHIREVSNTLATEALVITLWPHPRIILNKTPGELKLLNTLEEKIELFEKAGLQNLLILDFNKDIAKNTAEEFIHQYLVNHLHISHLSVGYNHRFGSDGVNDINVLEKYGKKFHFSVDKVRAFAPENNFISSSKIRNALMEGEVKKANDWLGYTYSFRGVVEKGNRIGHSLGFPTANLQVGDPLKLIPKGGVYAVKVKWENENFGGMMNIGKRPSLNLPGKQKKIEVHIFNFSQDIYDQPLEVCFLERVRDEKKFSDLDSLKIQLLEDKKKIQQYIEQNSFINNG